jgi:hypothetical protein
VTVVSPVVLNINRLLSLQITRINVLPPIAGRARLAYIEFGDEEALKAGLENHADVRRPQSLPLILSNTFSRFQKLKDIIPEVKQAIDRDSRDGGFRGRGRGGRGGSGFVTRGLAAAGLTRGGGHMGPRGNGDGGSPAL